MRLSKSKIGTYKMCPYRYYMTTIKGWRPTKIPAQLKKGIEVHAHMEYATKGAKNIQDVKENIKKRTIAKDQTKDIINFFNWQKDRNLPLYIEEKFYNEKLNFAGIVDRVDMDKNGKIVMIDYKTGKGKWLKGKVPDWDYYRFELALYTFLFESKHNQRVDKWGIYFSTINRFIEESVDRGEIIKAVDEVRNVRKQIQCARSNNDWPKHNSWMCRFCELYQNHMCDCGCAKTKDSFDADGKLVI